ncbi:hypothetical protein OF83DRAFT_247265 [Amylostereum chailletii]|nr:hypothetical protein OF83DRAFT_247265 [Amylostereum chailletii]
MIVRWRTSVPPSTYRRCYCPVAAAAQGLHALCPFSTHRPRRRTTHTDLRRHRCAVAQQRGLRWVRSRAGARIWVGGTRRGARAGHSEAGEAWTGRRGVLRCDIFYVSTAHIHVALRPSDARAQRGGGGSRFRLDVHVRRGAAATGGVVPESSAWVWMAFGARRPTGVRGIDGDGG